MTISRRALLIGLPLLMAGCTAGPSQQAKYGALPDEKFPLKQVPLEKIKPELRRQEVAYETTHPAGTIVVDTPARRLYYVLGDNRAMRYGVGVGRNGYALAGQAYIGRKAEWPSWTPSPNMLRTNPEKNRKYAGGLPGGPNNPLGARAIYLYRGGNDTMFRIHGTNQPQSIGLAMSSGCVRMMNHDVIDLYERVAVGGRVVVLQA
ncbi:L,D-transpeptidase [Agrobacterium sp. a22-2]|uniref:L,D-transpeptidase n=1 Tax=Agrobacterium sp. a22-2 TaxID=2283840 RepID=UPI00144728AA|nr:L,D-transpeptidase [Agrobacterium sp. a22-2]NKN37890.1 L,D-transpeptidase [Agrobacterium sp. a22-2]